MRIWSFVKGELYGLVGLRVVGVCCLFRQRRQLRDGVDGLAGSLSIMTRCAWACSYML